MHLPEGYFPCPGNRAPSVKRWGPSVMVVLRGGEDGVIIPRDPFPIATTRWIHDGTPGDVIGIRKVEE